MRKRWLALLLLLVPLLDSVVLVYVALEFLGAVPTIALVVLTGLVGMLLVRAEGRRTLKKMRRSLARGEPPTDELLDGGLLIAAGAFLLTPGIVTDSLGLALALPVTRIPTRMALKKWVVVPYVDEKTGGFGSGTVYLGGFPDQGSADRVVWGDGRDPEAGPGFDVGSEPDDGHDVHDLDEDAYDIDVENVREDED